MCLSIRPAQAEDAEVLCRLNAAFNGDTGVTPKDVHRALLSSSEIVVIAEVDVIPAGFCCAQVHRSFCYPAPVAEVTEMYVDEPFRRIGCAGAMLAFLEEYLRQAHGVEELHLLTGCGNLAAQAAYRKAGFKAKNEQYMTKRLTAPVCAE